ncbi:MULTISPECIES: hypothetical protein [unclassified Ensifer]|uniref:hypothetical protein n=1 Tax=Ensifer TaxID=106591 RepID=UPI000B2642F4|nr:MULTISPECIES: hypothetical protein [unclassified Ensifer]
MRKATPMYPWDEDRRRAAAIDMQNRLNEPMAEKAKQSVKPGDNRKFLVFMVVVIFFKPFAEYCIHLYNTLAGYVHSLGSVFGF